ncbi:hypothetical protein [Aestuariivivens sp. NBU2969]|uniref:hypothetical protein n=1 Tax=Aestuariivivens sp. NBU2969 TaxID=2873267 RepID=UPI001CBBB2D1|nr:hypothetical protein [Aestuariivivens sp. NBU2969]
MKKIKWKLDIDWKSKLIDLLIVIIGITIAFQLNNFNESNKSNAQERDYLRSFYEENRDNELALSLAYEFALKTKDDIDTLKQILLSKNYKDSRIKNLSANMMALSDFNPSLVTMENITESGEFKLISDLEYREKLIDTYNSYKTTSQLESILSDYVNEYVTPFFFRNIRFSDFTSLNNNFKENPEFENIVIGYDALLTQKLKGYEENLEKLKGLNQLLTTANNIYTK